MERHDKLEQLEEQAALYGIERTRIFLYSKDRQRFATPEYGFNLKELSEPNQKKACWCLIDWSNPEPDTIAYRLKEMALRAK